MSSSPKNVSFAQAIEVEKTAPTVDLCLARQALEDTLTATNAERCAAHVTLRANVLKAVIAANASRPPRKDGGGHRTRNPRNSPGCRGRGRNGCCLCGGRGRRLKKKCEAAAAAKALNPAAKTAAQKLRSEMVAKAIAAGCCTHCKALVLRPSNYLFHLEPNCWKVHPKKHVQSKKRAHQ